MAKTMIPKAPQHPDDRAARYLLGLLPAAERERWEEGLLSDRHAFEATLAAENDLVDAYARGELGRRERAAFERSFLVRERIGERLAFARALAAATGRPAEDARGAAGPERRFARPPARLMRFAAAAAMVLLVGTTAVLGWRNSQLAGRLAEVEGRVDAGEAERARLAAERDRLAARLAGERQEHAAARAEGESERAEAARTLADLRGRGEELAGEVERLRRSTPPRATTVSFLLAAATRSAEGVPELELQSATGYVRLQLDTGVVEPYTAYQATLKAPGDRVAWSRTGIRPAGGSGRPAVELELPAEIFVSGRYVLELEGLGPGTPEPELVQAFDFEVVRR